MTKIGIISLYGRFNYGNRLQNYATYKVCQREGFAAESLALGKRFNIRRETKNAIKKLLGRPEPPRLEDQMDPRRLAAFDRFNSLIPMRYLESIDRKLADEYDAFIVGSDQVWNPRFFAYNEDWFFLRFAKKKQRIALAASIGTNKLSCIQRVVIARGVKGFSRLSVREEKGAELIQQCSGLDATVICDPTLALSAEEWMSIADNRFTPDAPYVFTYMLGDSSIPDDVMTRVAKGEKVPVVALTDREGIGEAPAGPSEFLSLIANASHVVTDSFHAALFAAVFEVPLTVVRRGGRNEMFSRIETLAKKLGIEDKVYGSDVFDLDKASVYNGTSESIARERENFIRFFRGSVNA